MIDQKRLVEKAAALGIDAAPCAAALDEYAALLVAYNEKVNLTAITEPAAIEDRHFVDLSLIHIWFYFLSVEKVAKSVGGIRTG